MGAKTQIENKKLDVPAPGAYDIPDKVSDPLLDLIRFKRLLRARARPWARRPKSSSFRECLDQVQVATMAISLSHKTTRFLWAQNWRT